MTFRSTEKRTYIDGISGEEREFGSVDSERLCQLTVVVPAYNEEQRLPSMLDSALEYLNAKFTDKNDFEIIVVDDGSSDATAEVAQEYSRSCAGRIKVLSLTRNRGKGGAVREGVLRATGQRILFADADGATRFADIEKLASSLDEIESDGHGIANGSRSHLEEDSIAQRTAFRTFLMMGFHFIVWLFAVRTIRDTQCGFKIFTRRTARRLFHNLHVERWAFDVELLLMAERLNIPMAEVAVTWVEVDGSKIVPVFSWLQMGRDILIIWFNYLVGIWTL